MTTTTSWLLPFLVVLFCLILAALAAQTVYVACYRRRFRRATSSAPPSTASDCERGLPFSPALSRFEGGARQSQELLLYQLCVKEHDGWQSGDSQQTTGRPARPGAAAAGLSNGSQPKAARKKVQYTSDTRTANDAAFAASPAEEGEKNQEVTRFREKYAARFLSPIKEMPPPKENSSNDGSRTSPDEAADASGPKPKEGEDEIGPDSFYTPPESPPRSRGGRVAPKQEQSPVLR